MSDAELMKALDNEAYIILLEDKLEVKDKRIEGLEKIADDIAYTAARRKERMRELEGRIEELEAALREILALDENEDWMLDEMDAIARKALGESEKKLPGFLGRIREEGESE